MKKKGFDRMKNPYDGSRKRSSEIHKSKKEYKRERVDISEALSQFHSEKEEVIRVEVIDSNGRQYVNYNVNSIEVSMQDEDKTMKIFVK